MFYYEIMNCMWPLPYIAISQVWGKAFLTGGAIHFQAFIVCEAHRYVKHANTRGSVGMPLRKYLKIRLAEIEFVGSFSGLSPIVSVTFSYICYVALIFS